MLLILKLLCFLTILVSVKCKDDQISVYLEKSNFAVCHTKNLKNFSLAENSHVIIHSFHQTFINFAWIELPKISIHFDPNLEVVELSLHKSMAGEWKFVFLHILSNVSTNEANYRYMDNNYYARATCTIQMQINTDTQNIILWLALLGISGLAIILIIVLVIIVVYYKRKGGTAHDFMNLTKISHETLDPDRYSTNPKHKKSMKVVEPIEEDRSSVIYENPEICLSGLGRQQNEPPLVPNTPRPVHQDKMRGPGSIHSASTLKLSSGHASFSQHPTLPRTNPPADKGFKQFDKELSQKTSRPNFVSSTLTLNSTRTNPIPQHTNTTFPRPTNGKSGALPPLPLENEEMYEEMDPPPEIYEELPESESPQMKRTSTAKIPGAILVSTQPLMKPTKPPVFEKPKRIIASNSAQQNFTALLNTQLNSGQPNKVTPGAFRPKAATTSGTSRPNVQTTHQTIQEEQPQFRKRPNGPSQHPSPHQQHNTIQIPVTEAIYNNEDEVASSDEEWFYEELKPDRYYRD